jgi:hypothetical protein
MNQEEMAAGIMLIAYESALTPQANSVAEGDPVSEANES